MKIALCQMTVIQGDREANHETAERMLEEAATSEADVAVLPELWSCGYDFDRLVEHQETLSGPSLRLLKRAAVRAQMWIVGGSLPILTDDGVQNMNVVVSPAGELVHTYGKVHLIGLMREDRFLTPGHTADVFQLHDVTAATMICYDLRFPELSRRFANHGAQLLFVPSEWPSVRQEHWEILVRARAIENQAYVIAVNMCGENSQDTFRGQSLVIDPWGETVVKGGETPEVLLATVNLDIVVDVRRRMSVLKDIRPEMYGQ